MCVEKYVVLTGVRGVRGVRGMCGMCSGAGSNDRSI